MSAIKMTKRTIISLLLTAGIVAAAFWFGPSILRTLSPGGTASSSEHDHHGHDDHNDDGNTIILSDQARKNIGLRVGPAQLGTFEETVTVPAMVMERPGRTNLDVAAPLTGFVIDVFAVPGQAVDPGTPLFVLQLTNEDLVQAQTDFLNTLLAVEVEQKEIARLQSITEGAIAEKVIINRKYELEKLEGQLLAQRQRLLLHGLDEEQIDSIASEHRLLREFLISAPMPHDESDPDHLSHAHPRLVANSEDAHQHESPAVTDIEHALVVSELPVKKGQLVNAGDTLIVLSDLSQLYIGGDAFERDVPALRHAAENDWAISAVLEQDRSQVIDDLHIAYVANSIDPQSRTLTFYVDLPNELLHKVRRSGDRVFPAWRFKPGQRMELRIPTQRWENHLVLPTAAVAQDGPERYVFVQNGKAFRRQPVHVIRQDRRSVVVANDGSLYPGTAIALTSAHQLQMALVNQTTGGIDPHAGHSH